MFELIIVLIVLALCFWGISLLPIPEPFLSIIRVVFIIAALVAVLGAFGFGGGLPSLR